MRPRGAGTGFAALLALAAAACASSPEANPRYEPTHNVLEVVAVLRRHVPDDTYRFEPAHDFTERNVYRSSLLRLESIERLHAPALRAGHMDGVIQFAKARALERLRAYDLAAEEYRRAARNDDQLVVEALRSADVCDVLHRAKMMVVNEAASGDANALPAADPETAILRFDERVGLLESLLLTTEGTHHIYVVREEIERVDQDRARYFVGLRQLLPEGDVRALSEVQRVILRHRESKNASRQLLELADLYAELTADYVESHPPEGLLFDPIRFQELVDAGARLYEMVSNRDGTTEKLEARRQLEAFLAFALRVDRDRFTP